MEKITGCAQEIHACWVRWLNSISEEATAKISPNEEKALKTMLGSSQNLMMKGYKW